MADVSFPRFASFTNSLVDTAPPNNCMNLKAASAATGYERNVFAEPNITALVTGPLLQEKLNGPGTTFHRL